MSDCFLQSNLIGTVEFLDPSLTASSVRMSSVGVTRVVGPIRALFLSALFHYKGKWQSSIGGHLRSVTHSRGYPNVQYPLSGTFLIYRLRPSPKKIGKRNESDHTRRIATFDNRQSRHPILGHPFHNDPQQLVRMGRCGITDRDIRNRPTVASGIGTLPSFNDI